QPNAFRSVKRDRSLFSHRNGLCGELGIDQFVEGNPTALFRPKEEPLRAAQSFKPILKAGIEIIERLTRSECPFGYPTHDADEVPCAVLEFRNDRYETILALAQRRAALFNALFQIAAKLPVLFKA